MLGIVQFFLVDAPGKKDNKQMAMLQRQYGIEYIARIKYHFLKVILNTGGKVIQVREIHR